LLSSLLGYQHPPGLTKSLLSGCLGPLLAGWLLLQLEDSDSTLQEALSLSEDHRPAVLEALWQQLETLPGLLARVRGDQAQQVRRTVAARAGRGGLRRSLCYTIHSSKLHLLARFPGQFAAAVGSAHNSSKLSVVQEQSLLRLLGHQQVAQLGAEVDAMQLRGASSCTTTYEMEMDVWWLVVQLMPGLDLSCAAGALARVWSSHTGKKRCRLTLCSQGDR
jgi:hypothetical protein